MNYLELSFLFELLSTAAGDVSTYIPFLIGVINLFAQVFLLFMSSYHMLQMLSKIRKKKIIWGSVGIRGSYHFQHGISHPEC
jgi:hypothetical protein